MLLLVATVRLNGYYLGAFFFMYKLQELYCIRALSVLKIDSHIFRLFSIINFNSNRVHRHSPDDGFTVVSANFQLLSNESNYISPAVF